MMTHATTANTVTLPQPAGNAGTRRRPSPSDGLAAGTRIGSWRVDGELGRGGMASVHAVAHGKFGSRAAIKIAHASILGDELTPETFLREARIARTVTHPGVIDIHATGTHAGRPYLVMERLTGRSLGQRVDAGPPMPRHEGLAILLELCDILRAAHAAGIVHRDLKLDNVFLVDGKQPRVKLLDWGVAFVEGEPDPFRGLIAGTLTYVAPEQIRGEPLTGAADIYSLSVLAYHLLCRRPPFASANDLALIHMHLRADPPRPSTAWPGVPAALDDLLLAMLAKDPSDRPTLDEVERELRAALVAVGPDRPSMITQRQRPIDVLGRPVLPVPPLRASWIAIAVGLTALAGLASALP